jgi:DNA-binding CsgD family transcriptional regulator/tetratricopeptide (TPR) repeat protein
MAFIGRERELALLGSALQRAAEGQPARVVVTGALGMGTSRLMDELVARVRGVAGIVVCRAQCVEPRSGIAYGPLRDAFGDAMAKVTDSQLPEIVGSGAYDVANLLPEVGVRLQKLGVDTAAPELDAPRQRAARVREALFGLLVRLGTRGPVVLIVEDLEHSDPATREFIGALSRTTRRLPVALVIGFHADEIRRGHPARDFVDALDDQSTVLERIERVPFGSEEIASLASAGDAADNADRPTLAFLAALNEGSRGNPLTAEQLLAAQQHLAATRLSDPLGEIVAARLDELDQQTFRVVRVLAAARRPMNAAALARLTLPGGHLPRNAVALGAASGLTTGDESSIGISHVLLAEAIETSLLPAERHALHSSLATLHVGEPAEAAWHLVRAGRVAEARAAHLAAADLSREVDPGGTTLGHLVAALELTDASTVADDADVLAAAAEAADAAGSFRRAAKLCAQAIERVSGGRVERMMSARGNADDRAQVAALCEQLGRYRRSSGDSDGAREAFEQALAVAPEDAPVRAAALAALAQELMLQGDFDESARLAEQARGIATSAGSAGRAQFAHATDTAAVDAAFLGRVDHGLKLLDEALASAREAHDLDEVIRCHANRTTLLDLDLRREKALAAVKDGIAEAARNGLGLTASAFLGGNAADILFQLGRWTEAEEQCRSAMEFPPAGFAWFSPILYLGLVLVESRADDEAAQLVGRTLLQLETVPAGQWSALVLRTAVSLALWRNDLGDAQTAAEQGWLRVLQTGDEAQIVVAAATVLEACAAAADAGRLERNWSAVARATTLANDVLPIAEHNLLRHPSPASVGARREAELHMATARAHHDRVRGRTKPETYAALADAWAKIPVPYQVAKARWWQAQAALPTRARRAEARRAILDAWAISGKLPAAPLRKALRDLAERGRITLPTGDLVAIPIVGERELVAVGPGHSPRDDGSAAGDIATNLADRFVFAQPPAVARFGLSPREYGVLLVLAEGRTNRVIADRLFISERTVAVHVRRILAKLGVSGRVEAAGVAIRLGIVPEDPRRLAART